MRFRWTMACLVVFLAPITRADIIYNSFGPGNTYSSSSGISIIGSSEQNGPQSAAGSFTVSATTKLSSATFAITGDPVELELTTNNGGVPAFTGTPADTPLDSFAITPSNTAGSTVTITLSDILLPGTYWFVASPGTTTAEAAWFDSPTLQTGSLAFNKNGVWSPNTDTLAFSVSAVPAPTSLEGGAVILLIGLGLRGRRRCRGEAAAE